MASYTYPRGGSVGIADPVPTITDLPAAGTVVGQLIVTQDTGTIYEWNGTTWQVAGGGGGSGDVTGPASSVANQGVIFNGTSGKAIKAFTATGVVKSVSGVLSTSLVDLASEVTGVLPVANGGTNSSTALSNNRVVQSSAGKLVEAAAITAARALISDANGIPTQSATTSAELAFVSGVTSAIQTQLNARALAARQINTTAPLAGGGDLSADRTLSIPQSTGAQDGYLAAADFATFAAKVSATRSISTTAPLTGGGDLSADRTIAIPQATGSVDGYLAAVDFATFAAKQPAGNYITALTGDVTATGPGSVAATIAAGAVTNAKIAALAGISVNKLAALTVSSPVRSDGSGFLTTGSTSLTSEVSGVLPVANGGTNSSTALSNNRVVVSSGSKIVEASAITGNRALASDSNGLPVASTTTDTELGYLSGVTSSIQTQIDSKVAKAGDTMTGFLTLNADPTSALHAATKQYVDNIASGLSPKESVFVATTANITLLGEQTIDGVLTSASRVLVKSQTLPQQNGIYVSAAGAWSRSTDMDSWTEVPGAFIFVEEGTTYAETGWVCTSDPGGTLGVTAITFVQFAGTGTYTTDGQGIVFTGNQLSLVLDSTTLSKSGSGLKVATGGITNTEVNAAAAIARSKLASGNAFRVVVNDTSGVLVDAAAITASRALASDANGIPVASATTAAELAFVNGVTSSIQIQLNAKQPTGNYITDLTGDVTATGPGSAVATIAAGAVTNTKIAAAAGISLNKLAALTANKAVASDSSGFLVASTTSDTELGYVAGVTSAIQTQLNSKIGFTVSTISANTSLVDKTFYLVDTSAGALQLTLPVPSATAYIVVKDKAGQASGNPMLVKRHAAEQIEGASADFTLDTDRVAVTIISDGTNWYFS